MRLGEIAKSLVGRLTCQTVRGTLENPERNQKKDEQPVANLLRNTSNRDVGPLKKRSHLAVPNKDRRFAA